MEQREQAVDVDVQMASETRSICPKPTSSHLHLPGPAEAEHNAGRVSGGAKVWTWPIMSADHQGGVGRGDLVERELQTQSCCSYCVLKGHMGVSDLIW